MRLTGYALKQGLKSRKNQSGWGTFIRMARRSQHLMVVQDGNKTAYTYSPIMWEIVHA